MQRSFRTLPGLLCAALVLSACRAEFTTFFPQIIEVQPRAGAWRDTLVVTDVDTFEVVVTLVKGDTLAGLNVEWQSSDPAVLSLAPIASASPVLSDSLRAHLRVVARAEARGVVEITVRANQVGFEPVVLRDTIAVMERWIAVSVGDAFVCALNSSHDAYCWGGGNFNGRSLGNGSELGSPIPVAVLGGLKFASISAGQLHACGVTLGTRLPYCWGDNDYGQLGDGTTDDQLIPTTVSGGRTFQAINTGGRSSCGITRVPVINQLNGMCWGRWWHFPESTRVNPNPLKPDEVNILTSLTAIASGWRHACALTSGGQALCWGDHFLAGRLGTGVTAGPETCALDPTDGQLNARSYPSTFPCSRAPVAVAGSVAFESLSAAAIHTCGVATDRRAYCWGYNLWGDLGDSSGTDRPGPARVASGNVRFLTIAAAGDYRFLGEESAHTCALGTDSLAYCWGDNRVGQLGLATTSGPDFCNIVLQLACSQSPRPVALGFKYIAVSAGAGRSSAGSACAIRPSGALYCWGSNAHGKLGNPSVVTFSSIPVRVEEPAAIP